MRLIDADALERDGWRMSRIVQIDEKTMEAQTRKPTDFPTIEPERIRGRWIIGHERRFIDLSNADEQYRTLGYPHRNYLNMQCSVCHKVSIVDASVKYDFCPHCGAEMSGGEEDE